MKCLRLLLAVAALTVVLSVPADRFIGESVACPSEVYAKLVGGSLSAGDYITIGSSTSEDNSCGGHNFDMVYADCVVSSSCGPTGPTTVKIAGTSLSGDYHVTAVDNGCITMCRCQ